MRIGVLTSEGLLAGTAPKIEVEESQDELRKLQHAFEKVNLLLEPVLWNGISSKAAGFDALLPLLVWDYFDGNREEFLREMERASQLTELFNPYSALLWNSEKSYLKELGNRGVPIVETLELETVSQPAIEVAFERFGCRKLVIKPKVGGGAWRQVLYEQGEDWPNSDELPIGEALVQPFLPNIKTEGEFSFLYFGGEFSHALVKRPQPDDYRIQATYGGIESVHQPSESELATAELVLTALDFQPLYARVDLLRGEDGGLKLMELELIEPYLYLEHSDVVEGECIGAQKFAAALASRLC